MDDDDIMMCILTQYPARLCFVANWQNYEILLILNHLQFISLIFTFRCFCLNCARGSPLFRYNGIGSRRAYRECGSYAWAPGHQDHTDLRQGAAHHHRAPCHSPAAFNQLRHDRIFPLVTATFPTHGRWQLFFRIYTSAHVCRTMHED